MFPWVFLQKIGRGGLQVFVFTRPLLSIFYRIKQVQKVMLVSCIKLPIGETEG